MVAKSKVPKGRPTTARLRGIYMGLLNGVDRDVQSVAKKIRARDGLTHAVKFLREFGRPTN
jgi:hypothetical protein